MATDISPRDQEEVTFDQNLTAIDDALSKARAQLGAMTDAASAADQLADENAEYSLHEVHGVGRYAVVRKTGWRPLLKVIHDPAANIDFSVNDYPGFDAIMCRTWDQAHSPLTETISDPLNDKYESHKDLRDNISAVRNFLMETYYVDTPPGMTPEKAKQAMEEIAKYIAQGLDNNYAFLGVIPNHHVGKPFIDMDRASEPGGAGAQYIYEKVLEMHRQSSWMRPFSAVIQLFGGQTPPDWKLPSADMTEFTDVLSHDIAPTGASKGPAPELLEHAIADIELLEGSRRQLIDRHDLSNTALDLHAMGDQLLFRAGNMQNVASLSDQVRQDAIEIAKDILKKLRFNLGDVNIRDGLNLPPTDDIATLGGVNGVALVYERMLRYARGIDPSIMQHPSVMAGIQAIGQVGVLAKREALRMAQIAGKGDLANTISGQLANTPAAFNTNTDMKMSELLDRIESGISVLMNRVQTISGPSAQIGKGAAQDSGSSINSAPTAGLGQQTSGTGHNAANDAARLNAQMLAVQQANQQSQAARLQQQQNTKRPEPSQGQQPQQPQRSLGRQIFQQVRSRQSSSSTSTSAMAPTNPAQRNNPNQNNAARAAQLQQQHEHEEHEMQMKRLEAQRTLNNQQAKSAAKAAAAAAQKIDPNMLRSFQSATNTRGMGPVVSPKKPVKPMVETVTQNSNFYGAKPSSNSTTPKSPNERDKNVPPVVTPPGKGGRGF